MAHSKLRAAVAALAAASLGLLGLNTSTTASAAIPDDPSFAGKADRFSLGILPDTQFYSRYATEETNNQYQKMYGSEPFNAQTQWLADNAKASNIAGVLHLGDVVDQANHPQQWAVADEAMGILEAAKMPYSVLAGNHDFGGTDVTYTSTFPTARAQQQVGTDGVSRFVSATPDQLNTAYMFPTAQGHMVLNIALSWGTPSAETFAWAQSILDAHPGMPTIITSHQILNIDADGVTPIDTDNGNPIWDQLIAKNDQVIMTYNGHHHGAAMRQKNNDFGHPVVQVLVDYQMAYMGGNGLMALTEFDLTHGAISQTSFSPWVPTKPANTLTGYDVALLEGANQSWTVDFDFASRFPDLKAAGSYDSATKALRDHLSATYHAPAPREMTAATDAKDYVKVDGTVAHWRMAGTGADGAVLPVGTTITDVAGTNPMTRHEGTGVWAADDVTASADHDPLSADFGSVCFTDAGRQTGADGKTDTANFFATADKAPANAETFPNGFTFETFVKIDPSYTANNNRWMAWLSRDGQRQFVPGYVDGGDGEEPLMSWAFSNLNEVQYTFVDNKNPAIDSSAWSGEIVNFSEWMHLVAVNDPADKSVTMYVNGEPVLRNTVDQLGMASQDLPWVLGAGSYAGARQSGFVGCIGETRLVDHPLAADEWLTARAATTAPSSPASPSVSTEPSASTSAAPSNSPSTSAKPSTSVAPSTSTKPSASMKPSVSTKPSTSAAPSTSNGPSTSTAPSASKAPSTSKTPSTSAKPSSNSSAGTQPNPTAKPSDKQDRPTGLPRTGGGDGGWLVAAALATLAIGFAARAMPQR